jgi:hypothetical protein
MPEQGHDIAFIFDDQGKWFFHSVSYFPYKT